MKPERAELYGLPTVVIHDNSGFVWGDAVQGAAVGFGFAVLLAAGVADRPLALDGDGCRDPREG
jgi:hypothetical protein